MWFESHFHQEELLKKSHTSMIIIWDSVIADLRRYPNIWERISRIIGPLGQELELVEKEMF